MADIITGKVTIHVTVKVEIVKGSNACIQHRIGIEAKPDELTDAFKYLADKVVDGIKSKKGFTIKNKARTVSIVETEYLGKKNRKVDGIEFSNIPAVFKDIGREYKDMIGASPSIVVPVNATVDNPVILEK